MPLCHHERLQLTPSPFAPLAGFERLDARHLSAAESSSCRLPTIKDKKTLESQAEALSATFPAPLVLPWDDLNLDPECEGQSFKEWVDAGKKVGEEGTEERYRNKVGPGARAKRRVVYVAGVRVGEAGSGVFGGMLRGWARPNVGDVEKTALSLKVKSKKRKVEDEGGEEQRNQGDRGEEEHFDAKAYAEDVVEYLSAFYHGMEVKHFPSNLQFVPWSEKNSSNAKRKSKRPDSQPRPQIDIPPYIGLSHPPKNTITRIRVRNPSPDGMFPAQLNLNDILDAAITMLPADAYAMVLLVDHDMYEDENDDFCCGRAYGGSRVCVVSSARYNPLLDKKVVGGIDYEHMWPSSHCADFVEKLCREQDEDFVDAEVKRSRKVGKGREEGEECAIRAAISAISAISSLPIPDYSSLPFTNRNLVNALHFSRIARTVSHELGHCFGIAHCVYYACNMQSTAGVAEDVRQPPYLCPVCLKKVSYGIACELGGGDEKTRLEYVRERYGALLGFCGLEKWRGVGMFEGFGAWVGGRLGEMGESGVE